MSAFGHLAVTWCSAGVPCCYLGYLTSAKDDFRCYCCQGAEPPLSPQVTVACREMVEGREFRLDTQQERYSFFLSWASPPMGLANSEWWRMGPLPEHPERGEGVACPGYIPASPSVFGLNGFVSVQQIPVNAQEVRSNKGTS